MSYGAALSREVSFLFTIFFFSTRALWQPDFFFFFSFFESTDLVEGELAVVALQKVDGEVAQNLIENALRADCFPRQHIS